MSNFVLCILIVKPVDELLKLPTNCFGWLKKWKFGELTFRTIRHERFACRRNNQLIRLSGSLWIARRINPTDLALNFDFESTLNYKNGKMQAKTGSTADTGIPIVPTIAKSRSSKSWAIRFLGVWSFPTIWTPSAQAFWKFWNETVWRCTAPFIQLANHLKLCAATSIPPIGGSHNREYGWLAAERHFSRTTTPHYHLTSPDKSFL